MTNNFPHNPNYLLFLSFSSAAAYGQEISSAFHAAAIKTQSLNQTVIILSLEIEKKVQENMALKGKCDDLLKALQIAQQEVSRISCMYYGIDLNQN